MTKRLLCLVAVATFLFSCGQNTGNLAEQLSGNWLLLYPDHKLYSQHQREVYGRHQDSLIRLYGLKLFSLNADGTFYEMDSVQKRGKWLLTADSTVKIRESGKGFNPFNASYAGFAKDELQLTQVVRLDDEDIKIVWHFKKILEGTDAVRLFSEEANAWRKLPVVPEDKATLQKRLASMLSYYGTYFSLVGKEAIYFSPGRIPLPLHYYQHSIELNEVLPAGFRRLFYNDANAIWAYDLLAQAIYALRRQFPRDQNFVIEYGLFLQKLSDWVARKSST